jgi:hypothetical protein
MPPIEPTNAILQKFQSSRTPTMRQVFSALYGAPRLHPSSDFIFDDDGDNEDHNSLV